MEKKGKENNGRERIANETKGKKTQGREKTNKINTVFPNKKNYYLCVGCSLGQYILEQKPLPELARNKWLYSRPFLASVLCY